MVWLMQVLTAPEPTWLKQKVLAQKGVLQVKWMSSSQAESKTRSCKGSWRLGNETVYLECACLHWAQQSLLSWVSFENTAPPKRLGFDGNFHTGTFAKLFREVLKSVGGAAAPAWYNRSQHLVLWLCSTIMRKTNLAKQGAASLWPWVSLSNTFPNSST